MSCDSNSPKCLFPGGGGGGGLINNIATLIQIKT